nr:PREDICTED: vesicle transport protein GOT1A [Lepisosteus oculatus]
MTEQLKGQSAGTPDTARPEEKQEDTMITVTDVQKLGVGLTAFGLFFLMFGVLLYFDSVLLAFGNILFLAGLAVIIGLRRTFQFFFQRHKLRGSAFFLGGVALVLLRWPVVGMVMETYGFVLLFRTFFPMAFGFLGSLVNIPFLGSLLNRLSGSSSSMV